MAIRNYVGARYVPKFANPVEWQANTSYEALTIVTFNNASYTSKVPVLPTVGNPADNPDYWTLTGNYNAQVEQYRQTAATAQTTANQAVADAAKAQTTANQAVADAAKAQTTANQAVADAAKAQTTAGKNKSTSWLYGKKVYIFGDSLYAPGATITARLIERNSNTEFVNKAVAGTAASQMADAISNTSLSDADVVLIGCVTNNWQASGFLDAFTMDLRRIISNIKKQTETAEIVFIAPPFQYDEDFSDGITAGSGATELDYIARLEYVARENNIPVINLYFISGCNRDNYKTLIPEPIDGKYFHPGNALGNICGDIISNFTVSHDTDIWTKFKINFNDDFSGPSDIALYLNQLTGEIIFNKVFLTSKSEHLGRKQVNVGEIVPPSGVANISVYRGEPVIDFTSLKIVGWVQIVDGIFSILLAEGSSIAANDQLILNEKRFTKLNY